MTRDQVITIVLNRCGNRAGDLILIAASELEILAIQERLEENPELPQFCEVQTTLTLTATVQALATPSDFLLEVEDSDFYITLPAGGTVPIEKDEHEALQNRFRDSDPTQPLFRSLRGLTWYFHPTPDLAYPATFWYYQEQTVLATNIENTWLNKASDLFIGELGMVIAGQYLSDTQKYSEFVNMTNFARARLGLKQVALEVANTNRTMGD